MGGPLLLLVACTASGEGAAPADTPSASPVSPSAPAPTTPRVPPFDWSDPSLDLDVGGIFRLRNCEGDAPVLCLQRDGRPVGTLELSESLRDAGEGSPDLPARVRDLYRSLTDDRTRSCGNGRADAYPLTFEEPSPRTVAGAPGMRFGFTGGYGGRPPSERFVGYMVARPGVVSVVSATALDAGACLSSEGSNPLSTADLAVLEPFLDGLAAAGRLPAPIPTGG